MTDTTPEAVERLIGPGAEAMPDGERLTALVQMCRALSAEVERLTSRHYTGSRVENAITAHWGSRCYDFAEGCSCCEAWAEYDRLTAALALPEDMAAVREALTDVMHYSRHDGLCAMIGGYGYCTCGLEAKLDAARAALAKQGGAAK